MAIRLGAPVASQQSRILRADQKKVSGHERTAKVPARISKNQMEVYRYEWRQDWGLDIKASQTVLIPTLTSCN